MYSIVHHGCSRGWRVYLIFITVIFLFPIMSVREEISDTPAIQRLGLCVNGNPPTNVNSLWFMMCDIKHGLTSLQNICSCIVNSVLPSLQWVMLKPTARTARPLLVDGGNNRINEHILLFHINRLCFHTFNRWLFKQCQQTFSLTRCQIYISYYNSYHQLSHDIQTFNQGHKIALIYIFTSFYICLQIIMIEGSNHVFSILSSTQTLIKPGDWREIQ